MSDLKKLRRAVVRKEISRLLKIIVKSGYVDSGGLSDMLDNCGVTQSTKYIMERLIKESKE